MAAVVRLSREGIIRAKVAIEAGYVNNPNDLGGPTKYGVTQDTARTYGYKGDMRDLTQEMAMDIYVKLWWNKLYLDDILALNPLLADRMFDYSINAGRANCVESLQRLLNVLNNQETLYPDIKVDKGMGPTTLGTIKAFYAKRGAEGMNYLMMALTGMQTYHYVNISEQRKKNETFTYGWLGRIWGEMSVYAKALFG
ncbi:hypothetical protein pEaSNUABM11_00182 [Erwinia phage pEa_SNUABM_11]|nr:hypothetical protein pEaSNUABM11_00182 [Erwinia phage pEa_SNUABM_11]